MKKSKKAIALFIAVVMISSMLGLNALAAVDTTKTLNINSVISDSSIAAEETFTQTFSLADFSETVVDGIRAFKLKIQFDNTNFSVTSVAGLGEASDNTTISTQTVYDTNNNVVGGVLTIIYADTDNGSTPIAKAASVDVVTVTYTAVAGATAGDYNFITSGSVADFIDCSNITAPDVAPTYEQITNRYVTPTFVEATKVVTIEAAGPDVNLSSFTLGESKWLDDTYEVANVLTNVPEGAMVSDIVTAMEPAAGVSLVFTNKDGITELGEFDCVGTGTTIEVIKNDETVITYKIQMYGDLDGDGWITYDDFGFMVDWFALGVVFDETQSLGADLDNDGYVTYDDLGYYINWFAMGSLICQVPEDTVNQ